MEKYNIIFYNDMGHLEIENRKEIPKEICDYAFEKIKNKINYATDHLNSRFYILRSGLDDSHVYKYKNAEITVNYKKLNKFNSKKMIYI
jgi:hypothetical protein